MTHSNSQREVQFSVPSVSSYEDQYTIHWNGSCVLQHLYAPDNTDILQLEKRHIYNYFKWGFTYISFNPRGLASQYSLDGEGLWRIHMKIADPNVPSLCAPNDFRVSISRLEYLWLSEDLAVGESLVVNLPSVPNWHTGEVYNFQLNANVSQVEVSESLLQYSYDSVSYWFPYNQTIAIKNVWTTPLSLSIWYYTQIFRYIDHEVNGQCLNFTVDSVAFDSTRAGSYLTLDITAPISLKSASLYVPNRSRADTLYRIVTDPEDYSYYTLGLVYGVYKVNLIPYYAWQVLENDVYGIWLCSLMPWDITGPTMWVPDGKCDIRDAAIVAKLFGSVEGDGKYDLRADITGPTHLVSDGKVDIRDVALVAKHFGEV